MAKNRIEVPAIYEPCRLVLSELRKIDPILDLHYVGEGRWVVGSVTWTLPRYLMAGRILAGTSGNPVRSRMMMLALYGFARIAVYMIHGHPDGGVVEDVRERDWTYRHHADEALEEALDNAEGLPEKRESHRQLMDAIDVFGAEDHAIFFRGRKSFSGGKHRRR